MMIFRALAIASLTSIVLGFSNTSPVIAWSSTSSITLNSLPSRLQDGTHTLAVVHDLVGAEDICDYDAVIIIQQHGLHAFDLRSLSAQSGLFRRVNSSPSTRQYPYVHSHPELDARNIARTVSSICQSRLSQFTLGNIPTSFEHSKKYVFTILMPDLSESGKARKDAMFAHESLLSQELAVFADGFSNHLVIFFGSPLPSLSGFFRRQLPTGKPPMTDYTNTRLRSGVLSKYQLLTAELITALLVVLFVILPIVFCGIKALASIQNTVRLDTTKSFNALEKKNQ